MREIGLIRWFGGYNLRNKKMNDFGFIRDDKNNDLYFNKGHVQCKLKELITGRAVTFQRGVNFKNDREQAIRIKLLKDEDDREIFYDFFYSSIFSEIELNDKSEVLLNIDEKEVLDFWGTYSEDLKVLFLYRLCLENKEFKLIEKINEENEFIRAMLILYWAKINKCSNGIIIKKAINLFKSYIEYIGENSRKVNSNINYNKKEYKTLLIEFVKACTLNEQESEEYTELLDIIQLEL
ncbi:S1 domain-containing protein [Clostridium felsineum]|uniref:hypothetical protein n=1 Tax=Clostridium felsineum TaxID=36839 RepID=UPI00098CAA9F|nr:hypothetical protein [Clostridium felsineum]URZ00069.1 hypothetical protein CLAUR_000520 [Clostridium felsineum]